MKKVKFTKKAAALVVASVMLIGGVGAGTLAWLTDNSGPVINSFKDSDISVTLSETTGEEYKMVPGWVIDKDPYAWVSADSEDCYLFIKVTEAGEVKVYETNADGTSSLKATHNLKDFIAYKIDEYDEASNPNGWHKLGTSYPGVYYKKIDTDTKRGNSETNGKPTQHKILASGNKTIADVTYTWGDDQVLTLPTVTKEMMDAITATGNTEPTLEFQAYAVQLWKTNKPNRSEFAEGDAGTADYNAAVTAAQFTPNEAWNQIK